MVIKKEKVLKCLYCMAYARIRTNYNQFAGYKYEPQSIYFLEIYTNNGIKCFNILPQNACSFTPFK